MRAALLCLFTFSCDVTASKMVVCKTQCRRTANNCSCRYSAQARCSGTSDRQRDESDGLGLDDTGANSALLALIGRPRLRSHSSRVHGSREGGRHRLRRYMSAPGGDHRRRRLIGRTAERDPMSGEQPYQNARDAPSPSPTTAGGGGGVDEDGPSFQQNWPA